MASNRHDLHDLSPLRIGDLVAPLPVVQGGMGVGISLSGLASAVANEGGVGVISAVGVGMLEPDFQTRPLEANLRALDKEIRRARELSKGLIGVNIMVALSNYDSYVKAAVEAGIDIIFSGAGLPAQLPEHVPADAHTRLVPIVSSARAAEILCRRWLRNYDRLPDAIVVEGPLAGGHLGFKPDQIPSPDYALEKLIPETVAAMVPIEETHGKAIPVIAAGGVYSGADMLRMRRLGAAAVQMGTRFVTTFECDASREFKEAYLACKPEDLILIESPVGLPGRAIRNEFLDAAKRGERQPISCPLRCIVTCPGRKSPYCIAVALVNAKNGDLAHGFAFAGANAHRATEIVHVHDMIGSLLEEYAEAVAAEQAAQA